MGNTRLNTMVKGEAMKFYPQLLTCGNCHYTRNNSEWYTSKETKILYCTKDCYLAKEHGINSYWNEDGSLNSKKFEESFTVVWEKNVN